MIFLSEWNWYGFLIAMGMVVGMFGAAWVARWRGFSGEVAFDICLWAIPLAIVGARLNFVFTDMIQNGGYEGWNGFLKVFGFDNGTFVGLSGLSIYGGMMGAILGIYFNSLVYKRHRRKIAEEAAADAESVAAGETVEPRAKQRDYKETFLNMMDLGAVFLVLGQAIGRWGNLANKELYGAEITNPAFQWFPIGLEINGTWYQALSFYESILNLLCFGLLLWLLLGKRRSASGFVVSIYFMWYGVVRAVLEMQRAREFMMLWGDFPVSLLDSIILIIAGLAIMVMIVVKGKKSGMRMPIYLRRDQWEETGRDMFEWGRDYHEKLPPLFKRKGATADDEGAEESDYGDGFDEDNGLPPDGTEVPSPEAAGKKVDAKQKCRKRPAIEEDEEEVVPPQPTTIECPVCGAELPLNVSECPFCGKKLH